MRVRVVLLDIDANGREYNAGSSIHVVKDTSFKAIWLPNAETCTTVDRFFKSELNSGDYFAAVFVRNDYDVPLKLSAQVEYFNESGESMGSGMSCYSPFLAPGEVYYLYENTDLEGVTDASYALKVEAIGEQDMALSASLSIEEESHDANHATYSITNVGEKSVTLNEAVVFCEWDYVSGIYQYASFLSFREPLLDAELDPGESRTVEFVDSDEEGCLDKGELHVYVNGSVVTD